MFHGVWPALTSPFRPDFSLDLSLFHEQVQYQVQAGVHGLILAGTLGEASSLEAEEKIALFQAARQAAPQCPIAVNVAESSTARAVSFVKALTDLGVDGFMLLPPMRYVSDEAETLAYFEAVVSATSKPILLYNNPVDYKIEITDAIFARLCQFENVVAVKESTRDMRNMTRLIHRYGERLSILCGVDNIALESLVMGARGWVAGLVCAFPEETVAIYNLIQKGRLEEAKQIYKWFLPLLDLDVSTKLVQNIKMATQAVGRGNDRVRPPRQALVGHEYDRVSQVIKEALAKRPRLEELV
ncbi:MAG: dihydrodipicolinate synthase family protein [Acidobacteria bacterium]|nr:dihydrodipicolinate synthase family protein [Acidobacteriota bacterium]MCB9399294.1 dihydrodipicolinate synthase family protein [Acidobacteriota bacterium]